ncbi:iron-sulfur cluster assembly scaffold protein [candidate division KSB1 bacterium]|nr:iron-sulfur cluster assembly scaffold protein [candidate division KSB1 bacterium]
MAIKYTQKVIEHFVNPRNVGELADADGMATEGSPACGDMVTFSLKVNPKTRVIEDIKFRSYGCASNIATASIATEMAIGKTIDEVKRMKAGQPARELGGLPPVKMHCSVLAINGLKAAIEDYEIRQGLIKEKVIRLSEEFIHRELKKVINPEIGINIVRLKMVREIKIKKGVVFVRISLGNTDEMYAQAISQEIIDQLEGIKGVRRVHVEFVEK